MDHTRTMIKELLKIQEKNGSVGFRYAPDRALEYAKWLSYVPKSQKQAIAKLTNKGVDELSTSDMNKLAKFNRQQELSATFERYTSEECSAKDVLAAYDYMQKNSIEKIMKSKLTKAEIEKANKLVEKYKEMSVSDLCNFVHENKEKENYNTLSMIEAYALHELDKISWQMSNEKTSAMLEHELDKNAIMRSKSYEKAIRPLR